jgi:cation transport regulator ChaC
VRGRLLVSSTILQKVHWGKGNRMRALLCGCGQRLEADEDGRLCYQVVYHLKRDHLTAYIDYEVAREMVTSRAYKMEYAVVYKNGTSPDEEFGPEPY